MHALPRPHVQTTLHSHLMALSYARLQWPSRSITVCQNLHRIRNKDPTATHSPHFRPVRSRCKTPLANMLDVGLSLRSLHENH